MEELDMYAPSRGRNGHTHVLGSQTTRCMAVAYEEKGACFGAGALPFVHHALASTSSTSATAGGRARGRKEPRVAIDVGPSWTSTVLYPSIHTRNRHARRGRGIASTVLVPSPYLQQ